MPHHESRRRPSGVAAHTHQWSGAYTPKSSQAVEVTYSDALTPPWDNPEKRARYQQVETRILCLVLRDVDNRLRQTKRGKLLPDSLQGPEELQCLARHILDRAYAALPLGWHPSTPQAVLDGDFESIVEAIARDSIMLYVDNRKCGYGHER